MYIYFCKGGFSCDGSSQEGRLEPRFQLAAFFFGSRLGVLFVVSPDYFLENELSLHMHSEFLCVSVCLLNKTRHACKSSVF